MQRAEGRKGKDRGGLVNMFIAIILLSGITVFTITMAIYSVVSGDKIVVSQRLHTIGMSSKMSVEEEKLSLPFYQRIIQPTVKKLADFLVRITPKERTNQLHNKVIAAGQPFGFGVNEWISIQALLIGLVPAIIVISSFTGIITLKKMILLIMVSVLLGIGGPRFILSSKIQRRQKEIILTLPDILDILTVSVEAGLGFDAALGKVVEKIPGVLSKEFEKVLQEIKMGRPRTEALKSMSERLGVVDLTTFIASVIQADQLGVSISGVLRIQSDQMRVRRRQRAQEKAMKAPVKMLLPMVFFIFPTIFVVLLGPSVIKMIDMFK